MVVADTPVQALLYFLNNNNFVNSGSKFCVFCSKMTYFNSPSLGVGNPLKVPLFWGGLLRQASMIPWTPWVSTACVVGVTVEHVEPVFLVCCMALVLKQI